MFEEQNDAALRPVSQEDLAAGGLRVLVAAASLVRPDLGLAATVIGEFASQFIPRQRADRMADFLAQVDERLRELENAFRERLRADGPYAELTEQVAAAAVRTASPQRHRDLAEILRTGLSLSDADVLNHQTLLRILEELNEAQILVLMSQANFRRTFGDEDLAAFFAKHPGVFGVHEPSFGVTDEKALSAWAFAKHQSDELVARHLLHVHALNGGKSPRPRQQLEITELGRMLLRAIGRFQPPENDE